MINSNNFVYSASAAARILGINVYAIARFEIWAYVCFVHVRGQRPTFISKKAFRQHFVEWRIERSQGMAVNQIEHDRFQVTNFRKNSIYSIWLFEDGLDCECEDYKNQIMIFGNGKACCKHAYAVLRFLGHNRLSDYVSANVLAT